MDEPIPKELRLGGIMTEEKEKSFINKITELEKDNKSLQKEVNSLQGFLTKSVNENGYLQKRIDALNKQIEKINAEKAKSDIYKLMVICMIKGMETD